MDKKEALGVDIGNVTLDVRATDINDKDLYENRYSTIPAVKGVIESLKKLNDEKEAICKTNNIGYFVDDRLEVLSHLVGTVSNLYLFNPDQEEVEQFIDFLPHVTRVENWEEIVEDIL